MDQQTKYKLLKVLNMKRMGTPGQRKDKHPHSRSQQGHKVNIEKPITFVSHGACSEIVVGTWRKCKHTKKIMEMELATPAGPAAGQKSILTTHPSKNSKQLSVN